jgi:hypothetical protein
MAIRSPEELESLLRANFLSVSDNALQVVLDTAIFSNERLLSLYIRPLRDATRADFGAFLAAARVYMGQLGDLTGGRVYENFIWHDGRPPCRPKNNWTCWVAANDSWRPD